MSPALPSADTQQQLPLPSHEDGDDNVVDVEILSTTDSSSFRCYHPVDTEWQQRTCGDLKLRYCGPNGVTPGGPQVPLTTPLTRRNVKGDGNCLFRSLSYIITGSETQHMAVRQAIVRHMRSIGHFLMEQVDREYTSIEDYIVSHRMDQTCSWGTEVEIFATAHLLNLPVFSYDVSTRSWWRYSPHNVDTALPE